MAYRVLTRPQGKRRFVAGAAHTLTSAPGFQTDLENAITNPDIAGIVLMDDSKTDLSRFVPWILHAVGRPVEDKTE